ncbi:MAG: DUF2069 domain-containing protein [Pseudomonadota bacterium]
MRENRLPRQGASLWFWLGLWVSIVVLLGTQIYDAWQRSAPVVVWVMWILPILILVPGVLSDRLRTVAWLCFVSMLYFLIAVPRSFAEPGNLRTALELVSVIGLFLCTMLYLRFRGRALREAMAAQEP